MTIDPEESEFGGKSGPAGIRLADPDRLTAAERLRLGYTVGKEDPTAPRDRSAWLGNQPESNPE